MRRQYHVIAMIVDVSVPNIDLTGNTTPVSGKQCSREVGDRQSVDLVVNGGFLQRYHAMLNICLKKQIGCFLITGFMNGVQ